MLVEGQFLLESIMENLLLELGHCICLYDREANFVCENLKLWSSGGIIYNLYVFMQVSKWKYHNIAIVFGKITNSNVALALWVVTQIHIS